MLRAISVVHSGLLAIDFSGCANIQGGHSRRTNENSAERYMTLLLFQLVCGEASHGWEIIGSLICLATALGMRAA
jgi:hypothetical protein